MSPKRVAIIGAGVSGLPAIKSSLEEGFHPVCYEMRNDVGGLWNFSGTAEYGKGSVMESTFILLSKELMSFSDHLMPVSAPNFLRHDVYQKYLASYADAYNLRQYIQFETEVVRVEKDEGYANNGKWRVSSKDKTGKVSTEEFDFVMVCTGIHGRPNDLPEFPGREKFGGEVVHAHSIRSIERFRGKRVVVVGLAATGVDMAMELCRGSSQVYLSSRSGGWIFSRISPSGHPTDHELLTRKVIAGFRFLPSNWMLDYLESYSESYFPNRYYGIKPASRIFDTEPMFSDHLPNAVITGQVIIHDNIKEYTKDGIIFEDGSVVENIDVVIMATGYDIQYPFLESILEVKDNEVDLYNYCFPPDLEHPTLAVIGCVQVIGTVPTVVEIQARYAARVFSKHIKLPSREQMWESLRQRKAADKVRFRHTRRNTVRVAMLPYCDILAEEIGCKPNFVKMLLTDPKLAWEYFFGPILPSHYRLTGPAKWSGARDAIVTVRERILPVNKSGKTVAANPHSCMMSPLACLFAVFCILLATYVMILK